MEVSVVKIGNSKGIRFSKTIIERYNIRDTVDLILDKGQIIIKPLARPRKGWEKAFMDMHSNGDDKLLIPDIFEDDNLDPTIGSEIKKTRPCVVISPDEMNKYLRTVIIAPMTTSSKKYPTRVEVKHDNKEGWIVLDQIRTIDKQRIIKDLGKLSRPDIKEVKSVLKETLVD
jgi:mRNA interferase MazF